MKQKVLTPSYLTDFKCIGGTCEDTCCAGWYIAVDEATYKKYKKVKDPVMKKRLDKELVAKKGAVSKEHVAKIKLKNNRCAFLSKEGWCDIYKDLGEHYLSQTCQLYPRTINKVNDTLEYSLALSCPEAARKILLNEKGISFISLEQEVGEVVISATLTSNENHAKVWQDYFVPMRSTLIKILQKREASFEARFKEVEELMRRWDSFCKNGTIKKLEGTFKEPSVLNEEQVESKLSALQYKLLLELIQMRAEKKWPSTRYETFYVQMLEGLGEEEAQIRNRYKEAYQKQVKPFFEAHPYILENYFVNYIYERAVPVDGESILKSYKQLFMYKELIALHLAGISLVEALTVEGVVAFLQAFTKVFDHNELYRQQLIKAMMDKERK